VFAPYTTGIGQVALAWNDLMDELGGLFTTLIPTGGDDFLILEKIWNVPKADRQKRDLLDAVVNYAVAYDFNHPKGFKIVEDLKWIMNRANALEDARNNAIHASLYLWGSGASAKFMGDVPYDGNWIRASPFSGSPRTKKLREADLLKEYRWCRLAAVRLRDFVYEATMCLWRLRQQKETPWLDRPKWPVQPRRNPPQDQRRPDGTGRRSRQRKAPG
jgi:hypothetical protein